MTSRLRNIIAGVITAIVLTIPFAAYAQGGYTLKFKLLDAQTDEPVAFATVSITKKGETTAKKYILTNDEGVASMTSVPRGTYVFKAELMGYKTYEKEIAVEKSLDMGEIKMEQDKQSR